MGGAKGGGTVRVESFPMHGVHTIWRTECRSTSTPESSDGLKMASKENHVTDSTINSPDHAKQKNRKGVAKCCRYCEIVVLVLVMFIIAGLFLVPTVFYAIPSAVPTETVSKMDL